MFSIIISEKGGAERRETFDKNEINVGRVQGNDLMLPKGNVSKHHARLLFRDGRFIVTDLKSTNGTYVNGRKIAQATIVREGDKIYIGDFVLRLEAAGGASVAPYGPPPGEEESASLLLLAALFFPRLGGREHLWWNGLYDSLCIILVFPLIVYLGASGELKQGLAARICKFLGEISYPIYIIHYPFIYLFTSWFYNNREFLMSGTTSAYLQLIAGGLAVLGSSITVAYLALKYYDIPVRKWLTQKFLGTAPK